MGQDVIRVLQTYLGRRQRLIRKLRQAQHLAQKTAQWAKKFGCVVDAGWVERRFIISMFDRFFQTCGPSFR